MRWRRLVRTVLVYALLGAVATVLSSWAIHAVQFWRLRSSASPATVTVPHIWWPVDRELARRAEIDTGIASGELGIDLEHGIWADTLLPRLLGPDAPDSAKGINADAAWRRHRRVNDRISPTPGYPFPFMLFETDSTRGSWRVLASDASLMNDSIESVYGSVSDLLILVRTGWPAPAMEVGAHYAEFVEPLIDGYGYKRIEELAAPPPIALPSGVELWAQPRPTRANPPDWPIQYAVTDRFALPLLPLWPGFAVNTFFYALLIFALVRTPRVLRRALRRRGGRCGGCGYDRTGLDPQATCPECGAGVRSRGATTAARAT